MTNRIPRDETPTLSALSVKELDPVDRIVTYFGYVLLGLITLVMISAIFEWFLSPAPTLTNTADKATLETAKAISEMQTDRISKRFDIFVLKGLLPSFATVLGYLIGKKTSS